MRTVKSPRGAYYRSMHAVFSFAAGVGYNQPTRCLALCVLTEITRLMGILGGTAAAHGGRVVEAAVRPQIAAVVIGATVEAVVIPGAIPAAGGVGGYPGLPAGSSYDQAIDSITNNATKALVDMICHYRAIAKNLTFNVATGDVNRVVTSMLVSQIPYAASAMQDAREAARAAGGLGVFATTAGQAGVGALPVGAIGRISFDHVMINHNLNVLYTAWTNDANRGATQYTNAAKELVTNLGPYCAYCEANLKTQIDVEHVMPKGIGRVYRYAMRQGFPSFAKYWDNFLPSCPRCNSTKSAHPSKLDITNKGVAAAAAFTKIDLTPLPVGIVRDGLGGDRRINDLEYFSLRNRYYHWPLQANSYTNAGFMLWDVAAFAADNTAIAGQINWQIRNVNEDQKYVEVHTGAVGAPGGIQHFQVYMDGGNHGGGHPLGAPGAGAAAIMGNTIGICGLNATHANTDRRLLERTEAWFMALAAVKKIGDDLARILALAAVAPLMAAQKRTIVDEVFKSWKENIILTIKEKGFFTVWLKIFAQFPHPLIAANGTVPTFPIGPLPVNTIGGAVPGARKTLMQVVAEALRDAGYFPNTLWQNIQ